jgi:hypothetical protein
MTEVLTRPKPPIDDPKELDRLVKQIVDKGDPIAIYLFGSRARGDADHDSDYDLMDHRARQLPGGPGEHPHRVSMRPRAAHSDGRCHGQTKPLPGARSAAWHAWLPGEQGRNPPV